MGQLSVKSVRIDEDGRLLVIPDLPPDRDFAFISRAARAARWDEAERALYTPAPETSTYFDRFQHLAEAAADEYGELLVVSERTQFANVPGFLEAEIREWRPSRRLTRRCS
jgi:hypothetical protein